jgi:arylsulfatase A-like enzyme
MFLLRILLFSTAGLLGGQPNILFIYLDDYGWKDAQYMGSDFYETPHIDALAREGLVFTDAYSSAANCAPARASLLSGQYAPRHQVFNVGTKARGDARYRRLLHIPGTTHLRLDIVTWAEALQSAGYTTGLFGKWHLGHPPGEQGFDVVVERGPLGFKGHLRPDGTYLADLLTDRAIEFIRQNEEKPWCAYLSHHAVHTPLQPKQELLAKYESKPPGTLHNHVNMATMIQNVDDGVGRLVEVLNSLKLRRKTAIFVYSDNGGYGPATDMDPLWGYKGNYYEGGIRVPFFVNWPGTIPSGETSEPIITVDLYPTFLEIAGIAQPDQVLDGQSLVPLLKGEVKELPERPLFWHFPAYLESYKVTDEQRDPLFRTRPCSIVRLGDYKLHEYYEDGALELYNLKQDIRERHNLAEQNPEKLQELHRILIEWRRTIGAPVPNQPNPEFDPEAEREAIEKSIKNQSSNLKRGQTSG